MLQTPPLARIFQRTRTLPIILRYAISVGIVLGIAGIRATLGPVTPQFALGHFMIAILLCAALFDHGAGFLATALSALIGAWLHVSPGSQEGWLALWLFVAVGATMTVVIESLHRALARAQRIQEELLRSERSRALLLREFRHRTRNDLGSLVGLLMLRARHAPSPAAREALREAADHALALARVHARLALDEGIDQGAERPTIDTRDFVGGLCADIGTMQSAEGLRPIRLVTEAESHPLSAERAVPLGLVVNETVTNALKYAFPEDRPGTVSVRFRREDGEFVLVVADDGIGLPPEGEVDAAPSSPSARGAGLGTRLLRALAAQLRGRFARRPGAAGHGTVAELRFAATEPGG